MKCLNCGFEWKEEEARNVIVEDNHPKHPDVGCFTVYIYPKCPGCGQEYEVELDATQINLLGEKNWGRNNP